MHFNLKVPDLFIRWMFTLLLLPCFVFSQNYTITLNILNTPNGNDQVVVVAGTDLEVEFIIVDDDNELSQNDIIRLVKVSTSEILVEKKRGNNLTGSVSLNTNGGQNNADLGECVIEYVNDNTVLASTPDLSTSLPIVLVADEIIAELVGRIETVEEEIEQGGIDGKSAYELWQEQGNNGTLADFLASLVGPQGEQGIQGPKGDKGDQGDQGIQGIQGVKGDKGDQGDQGIQGIQGVKGDKGDQGIQGVKGDKGDQGIQGIQGVKGDKGDKGDTGPAGTYTAGTGIDITGDVISTTGNLSIGDHYQGGIIFWLDASGEHGLIAAPSDQSTGIQWYNNGVFRVTNACGDGVGAGEMNTMLIIAMQTNDNTSGNYAAKVCADLVITEGGVTYGDWYLPSKYELNLLYQQKNKVGGFASNTYWSSSEHYAYLAWNQNFYIGMQYDPSKSNAYHVRAVRAF